MSFSFNAALSGLKAEGNKLNVIGNNIANSNTVGYREESVTFVDVFASRYGSRLNGAGNALQIGDGVQIGAIHSNFEQGNLTQSTSPLHAAVQGNGFFVVKNSDGSQAYTRAGDFTVNDQGFLISSSGAQVQGYQAQNGAVVPGTPLSSLKLPVGQTLAPNVTTKATLKMNLDSSAPADTNFHATMQVYDSLGKSRTLDMTFTKQDDGSWQMTAKLDGNDAQTSVDGAGASNTPVSFTFDSDGKLLTPADSLSIVPDATKLDGATLDGIDIQLQETNTDGTPGAFDITGFAAASAVSTTGQDGYAPGQLTGAAVDQNGNIYGVFSNGKSQIVGQYALATFSAPEGLNRVGGSMFAETTTSGEATIGEPNTGGRGAIAGGYLEQSNVNITDEFVDLIEAQRGFQANSKVITTINQTMQDLLQSI